MNSLQNAWEGKPEKRPSVLISIQSPAAVDFVRYGATPQAVLLVSSSVMVWAWCTYMPMGFSEP